MSDLAVTLAVGGDCLVDIAVLCAELGVYGLVASDPTVSRSINRLAADASGRWRLGRVLRVERAGGEILGACLALRC